MATKSGWVVEAPLKATQREIRRLPKSLRADLLQTRTLIEDEGLNALPFRYTERVEGDIWELRVQGIKIIARVLYLQKIGRRVILLHVFIKKKPKIERHRIELALQRAKEIDHA